MNNKAVADDWRIKLALPLFWLIDFLLKQPSIARALFDKFRNRENIRQVLQVRAGQDASARSGGRAALLLNLGG